MLCYYIVYLSHADKDQCDENVQIHVELKWMGSLCVSLKDAVAFG